MQDFLNWFNRYPHDGPVVKAGLAHLGFVTLHRLEATQKGGLDVTDWLEWFLVCLLRAVQGVEETLAQILARRGSGNSGQACR